MSWFNADDIFISEFTESATISSTAYDCIQSEITENEQYTDWGMGEGWDLILMFKVADFTSLPSEGDVVTFRSKDYRAIQIQPDSANQTFKVSLRAKV